MVKTCNAPCNPPCTRKAESHGLCKAHNARIAWGGDISTPIGWRPEKPEHCTAPGCDRPVHRGGLCHGHALVAKRGGDLSVPVCGHGGDRRSKSFREKYTLPPLSSLAAGGRK